MITWKNFVLIANLGLVLFVPAAINAASKRDLDRITPVADTEKIPVMDFFRPRLLQEP